jgi:hypothetical protein
MAMVFAQTFFVQIGFVISPDINQGADGHAMAAGVFGPEKEKKEKKQKSDDGDALHAPALPGIHQNMGIVFIDPSAAIQTDLVTGIEFLDMAAVGALDFHLCFTFPLPSGR